MDEIEMLKELLRDADAEYLRECCDNEEEPEKGFYDYVAGFLLANGVIMLPIKVGDTIYRIGESITNVYEWEVEHIEIYADQIVIVDDSDNEFTITDIGVTVYFTREEAEEKLRERNE